MKCPTCGGTKKVLSFIERHLSDAREKILRHCGLWNKFPLRAPPVKFTVADQLQEGISFDHDFFACLAS